MARWTQWLGLLVSTGVGVALAQVNVTAGGEVIKVDPSGNVSVKSGGKKITAEGAQVSVGPGNDAKSSLGEIDPDANIEGVTIINGKLWIDGKEIPPGVKRYKSPKTGTVYKIERRGTNISVTSEE